jgi:RimJ/RimL family protein N-acetyltransferase
MTVTFEKATDAHEQIIFSWLAERHVQEFWDNTQNHKDDILNFMDGRKKPSSYSNGQYIYWIAKDNGHPFAMFMTIKEPSTDDLDEIKLDNLSKTGNSYNIEYMIGDKNYLGKGYGAKTLSEFVEFFRNTIDPKADTFLIDPATDNLKAKHVYMKAGFKYVGDFVMSGNVSGAGKLHHLLIMCFKPRIE